MRRIQMRSFGLLTVIAAITLLTAPSHAVAAQAKPRLILAVLGSRACHALRRPRIQFTAPALWLTLLTRPEATNTSLGSARPLYWLAMAKP